VNEMTRRLCQGQAVPCDELGADVEGVIAVHTAAGRLAATAVYDRFAGYCDRTRCCRLG